MRNGDLLSFTGDYLKVVGEPRGSGEELSVELAGRQSSADFLALCKEDMAQLHVMARRMLLAHGVILETQQTGWEGGELHVTAVLRQIHDGVRDNLLPLIREGMYVARPHHFDGRKPISAHRAAFAVSQGFLEMSDEHLDALPQDGSATRFYARGTPGHLLYYPEAGKQHRTELLQSRLFVSPGKTHEQSAPVWQQLGRNEILQPGQFIAQRIRGIRARFHDIAILPGQLRQDILADTQDGNFIAFDAVPPSRPFEPKDLPPVAFSLYDRRPAHLLAPDVPEESARHILTSSFSKAQELLSSVEEFSAHDHAARASALVLNSIGIEHMMTHEKSPWMRLSGYPTDRERHLARSKQLRTPFAPEQTNITRDAAESSETRLLRQAQKMGMDAGAVLVSEVLPQHAALRTILEADVQQGRHVISTLLFRHPSAAHGPYFSGADYHALLDCCDKKIDVFWLNDKMFGKGPHADMDEGALLQLTRLQRGLSHSIAFVPPHRRTEFLNGNHIAFYGTARTLSPQYIGFMEELFEHLDAMRNGKPRVIHSGGGPNDSTMGIANRLAREHGFLSIGHVLGVKKEPMNRHLDGLMPCRNEARDLRQGNMARAVTGGVVQLEGGGGTREERGIAETDVAILTGPFPIILVGDDFYEHEYRQHLMETARGTLDETVLRCISLLTTDQAQEAADILTSFAQTGIVRNVIPDRFCEERERALQESAKCREWRQSAWIQH